MANLPSENMMRKQDQDAMEEKEDDDFEIESDCYTSCEEEANDMLRKVSTVPIVVSPPVKRTGPPQESQLPAGVISKKSRMSLVSDMNSNQVSVTGLKEQGDLQSGDEFPESPAFRTSRHTPTPVGEMCSVVSQSRGDVFLHLVEKGVLRNRHTSEQIVSSSPYQVPPRTTSHLGKDPRRWMRGFFDKPRSILPVEQALASTEALFPIYHLEVADMVERSKGKVEGMLADLKNKMAQVKKIRKHGLVHWGGGGANIPWIRLGEKEEDDKNLMEWREDDWVSEGVGRRTRAASRGRNSFQEYKSLIAVVENDNVRNKEDIYDYDEDDDEVKNQPKPRKKAAHESPFIDETDDDQDSIDDGDAEYGLKKKSGKGRGRGKGKRGGKGGGKGRGGRKGKVDNNPSVEQFFDPIEKSKSVPEDSGSGVDKPEVDVGKDENFHPTLASVSPTTAVCNRFLAGTYQQQEYYRLGGPRGSSSSRTRPDKRGTCPMCDRLIERWMLQEHAERCQGSS